VFEVERQSRTIGADANGVHAGLAVARMGGGHLPKTGQRAIPVPALQVALGGFEGHGGLGEVSRRPLGLAQRTGEARGVGPLLLLGVGLHRRFLFAGGFESASGF